MYKCEILNHLPTVCDEAWFLSTNAEWFKHYIKNDNIIRSKVEYETANTIIQNGAIVVALFDQSQLLGIALYEELKWDSSFFGFKIAKIPVLTYLNSLTHEEISTITNILLTEITHIARKNNIVLLQRRLLSDRLYEIKSLENNGFNLADNVVSMLATTESSYQTNTDIMIREITSEDTEPLAHIMKNSFPYSRFTTEPMLSMNGGDKLYSEWFLNSLKTEKNKFLVAAFKNNNRPIGFVSWFKNDSLSDNIGMNLAFVDLFVVDKEHRGRSIGKILLSKMLYDMHLDGISSAEASTWMNHKSALSVYQKKGFLIKENLFTFHKLL